MKSHNDIPLIIGLLFIGVAGGFAGRFLERQDLSFPVTHNLNQAAAILATQENIVGKPAPEQEPTITLGLGASVDADISFSRSKECAEAMTIKAVQGRTIGFLCVRANEPRVTTSVLEASTRTNALVVSLDQDNEKLAREFLNLGASVVLTTDKKIAHVYTTRDSLTGHSFKLHLTGRNVSSLSIVKNKNP